MKNCLLFFSIFIVAQCNAQKQANNWYYGFNAGITFNVDPPVFLPGGMLHTYEGVASISDTAGNLLFYSEGIQVWDSSNSLMPNGTGMYGGISSTQSCIIVPKPGSTTLYYLFSAPNVEDGYIRPLSYSIVDMTLNGGMGDVSVKNLPLLDSVTEKLTAVQHGNGEDYWVISHTCHSADFYAYKISSSGIDTIPVISTTGTVHGEGLYNSIGYLKASPCGNKLAAAVCGDNFLELFDFDDMTGVVSNPMHLGDYAGTNGAYGVEFSPNCSKLYVGILDQGLTIQYNLLAGTLEDIIASGYGFTTPEGYIGALQNGPDGRMYIARYSDIGLDCITNPNELPASINYVASFITSGTCQDGLPNFVTSFLKQEIIDSCNANFTYTIDDFGMAHFINLSVGSDSTPIESYSWSFCDGYATTDWEPIYTPLIPGKICACLTITDVLGCTDQYCIDVETGNQDLTDQQITVFSNPNSHGEFSITSTSEFNLSAIFDLSGRTVPFEIILDDAVKTSVKLLQFSPGIYFARINLNNDFIVAKIFVQ